MTGRRIGVFSFGSGLASSLFSIRVRGSTEEIKQKLDIQSRLDSRKVVDPKVYDEVCEK
jgi:hydroxymethylglutaryl-CoA synthase